MTAAQLAWTSSAATHQGNVRDHNEDSCLDAPDRGLWVVADGMGGHDSGDYASQLIVERLGSLPAISRASAFVDRVEDELLWVNRHLYDKSQAAERPTVIGSTVVALLACGTFGVVVWAGDSRLYLLRDGLLRRVSRDHSEVQILVERGLVQAHEAEFHPQANVITRAVGGSDRLDLDMALCDLRPGDRFLLCSDGLYKDMPEQEIAQQLASGDCRSVSAALLSLVLSRECKDNVTVIVVDIGADPGAAVAAPAEPNSDDATVPGARSRS